MLRVSRELRSWARARRVRRRRSSPSPRRDDVRDGGNFHVESRSPADELETTSANLARVKCMYICTRTCAEYIRDCTFLLCLPSLRSLSFSLSLSFRRRLLPRGVNYGRDSTPLPLLPRKKARSYFTRALIFSSPRCRRRRLRRFASQYGKMAFSQSSHYTCS